MSREGRSSTTRALIERLSVEAKAAERTESLKSLDLTGVDLSGLDLRWISFDRIPVRVLLQAGLSPRNLLQHRWHANRKFYRAVHFCAQTSPFSHILLTARECNKACQALQEVVWEELSDERIFTALYPQEPWADWIGRVASREIFDWALAHRAFLEAYYPRREGVPFYGRVLPSNIIDEVQPGDLVAGIKTDPERLFYNLGLRQVIRQSDLQGEDVPYPASVFADGPDITQIRSRRGLQIEGGLMRHCVASYDRLCRTGETLIYHVGAPAPLGSTLELSPQGRVLQHRALNNALPTPEDRTCLDAWLESLGLAASQAFGSLRHICQVLRAAGIARVTWEIYWEDDQNHLEETCCFTDDDTEVGLPRGISEEDVERLAYEAGFGTGVFALDVQHEWVERTGEPTHEYVEDEDEDDWEDEGDEDEEPEVWAGWK